MPLIVNAVLSGELTRDEIRVVQHCVCAGFDRVKEARRRYPLGGLVGEARPGAARLVRGELGRNVPRRYRRRLVRALRSGRREDYVRLESTPERACRTGKERRLLFRSTMNSLALRASKLGPESRPGFTAREILAQLCNVVVGCETWDLPPPKQALQLPALQDLRTDDTERWAAEVRRFASYADTNTVTEASDARPDPHAVYIRIYRPTYNWADRKQRTLESAQHYCCDPSKGECAGPDHKSPPGRRVSCRGPYDCKTGEECGYWDSFRRNPLGINMVTSYGDVKSLRPTNIVVRIHMGDMPEGMCHRVTRMTLDEAEAEMAGRRPAPPRRNEVSSIMENQLRERMDRLVASEASDVAAGSIEHAGIIGEMAEMHGAGNTEALVERLNGSVEMRSSVLQELGSDLIGDIHPNEIRFRVEPETGAIGIEFEGQVTGEMVQNIESLEGYGQRLEDGSLPTGDTLNEVSREMEISTRSPGVDAEMAVADTEGAALGEQLREPGSGLREPVNEGGLHGPATETLEEATHIPRDLGEVKVQVEAKVEAKGVSRMRDMMKFVMKRAFGAAVIMLGAQAIASNRSGWFLVEAPGFKKPKQLTHRDFWSQDAKTIRFPTPAAGSSSLGAGTFSDGSSASPVTRYCNPEILCEDADSKSDCQDGLDASITTPQARSDSLPSGITPNQDLRSLRCGVAPAKQCESDADCGQQGGTCDVARRQCRVRETVVVIRIDNMSLFDVCGAGLSKAGYWVGDVGDEGVKLIRAGVKTVGLMNRMWKMILDHPYVSAGIVGGLLILIIVIIVVARRKRSRHVPVAEAVPVETTTTKKYLY